MANLISEAYGKNEKDEIICTRVFTLSPEGAISLKEDLERQKEALEKVKAEDCEVKIAALDSKIKELEPLLSKLDSGVEK